MVAVSAVIETTWHFEKDSSSLMRLSPVQSLQIIMKDEIKDWMRHDPWELHKVSKERPSRDWFGIVVYGVCGFFAILLILKIANVL